VSDIDRLLASLARLSEDEPIPEYAYARDSLHFQAACWLGQPRTDHPELVNILQALMVRLYLGGAA